MKKGFRIICLALCLALMLPTLSACGKSAPKEPDAAELLRQMNAAMAQQNSLTARITGTMELSAAAEGATYTVPVLLALDCENRSHEGLFHARGSVTANLLQMPWEIPLEMYAREDTVYLSALGIWGKTEAGQGLLNPTAAASAATLPEEMLRTAQLREEAGEIDGRSVCRIDLTVPEEMIRAAAGDDKAAGIDWHGAAAELMVWLDRETMLPVRQILRCSGVKGEGFAVNTLDLQMDYTGFNNAPEIAIPPEALNAPEGGAFFSALG